MGKQSPPRQLRSAREIAAMRQAGLVVWNTFAAIKPLVRPGVSTAEIDAAVRSVFARHSAQPLFLNFPNSTEGGPPFPAATCISINEEVVHGIPSLRRKLAAGDVVSIDTGCKVNGWCGDAAFTFPVGEIDPVKQKLLAVTRGVLSLAIELMGKKSRWNEVAAEMEKFVRSHRFSVVEDFVGHGIGRDMHEEPHVENFRQRSKGPRLQHGLVLALEPMVSLGNPDVEELSDHWTVRTKDGSLCCHFEHTIAIRDGREAEILTLP
jgi:methionyl aminopeptidase